MQLVEVDVADDVALVPNPATTGEQSTASTSEPNDLVDAAPTADPAVPEVAREPARRRPIRERLTMQLATRRALLGLVEHPTAPDGGPDEVADAAPDAGTDSPTPHPTG